MQDIEPVGDKFSRILFVTLKFFIPVPLIPMNPCSRGSFRTLIFLRRDTLAKKKTAKKAAKKK